MIFVAGIAFSQKKVIFSPQKKIFFSAIKPTSKAFQVFTQHRTTVAPTYPVQANFYASNLGFFCKQEIKFEKSIKIPFKFRLGSVQQCDWLEGKRYAGTVMQ